MSAYVPSDCLAFIEGNDVVEVADGISTTEAWTKLAAPLGTRPHLVSNGWLIKFARWTGIGSSEPVLLARSQFALVFMDVEKTEVDATINIKPLMALIIETHTTQRRMRPIIEKRVDDFAQAHGLTSIAAKQIDGVDLYEWSSPDGRRHIVAAFVGTVAIIGNNESTVMKCVNVRNGRAASLAGNQQLGHMRQQLGADAPLFGYVTKTGVKPILTAWAFERFSSSPNVTANAAIFADIFANLIDGLGWSSRFTDGASEDRCFLALAEGVADKLRADAVPENRSSENEISFVPYHAYSYSTYHFHDTGGVWRNLNAVISSHADLLGAVAARAALRSLFSPYGINDPDTFVRSVGARLQTIRTEENAHAVLVADAFDLPALRTLALQKIGSTPKSETLGDTELLLSTSDNWSVAFAGNRFLIAPADQVRTCLQAKAQNQSLTSVDAYRRSQKLVDVSMPIIVLTFTDDRRPAISFVELFSETERPAFSANALTIDSASRSLSYAVSATTLKQNGFEWTSRSSFGLLGSIAVKFAPQKPR